MENADKQESHVIHFTSEEFNKLSENELRSLLIELGEPVFMSDTKEDLRIRALRKALSVQDIPDGKADS